MEAQIIEISFVVGRVLFGGYFTMMGINHFMKKQHMVSYAQTKGVPAPGLAVAVSGLLLLVGGLGILFGIYVQLALLALLVFLIPTTFMMHKFWKVQDDPQTRMSEMINFMKNMALIGAILMLGMISVPWIVSVI